MDLHEITEAFIEHLKILRFARPISIVYNPLLYARKPYNRYLERFGRGRREIVLVGMNPGPFGMAQTGVPFGDVVMVRDWMGIEELVEKPALEHPKRPIEGFSCKRREVSGTRLWSWARDRFGPPEAFFSRFFVLNYCPLCFLEPSGRNLTPDKLPARERQALFTACDYALLGTIGYLQPRYVVGIGRFAAMRVRAASGHLDIVCGQMPHPSPANPEANSPQASWSQGAEAALARIGITF